jgi:hypothetical protein
MGWVLGGFVVVGIVVGGAMLLKRAKEQEKAP